MIILTFLFVKIVASQTTSMVAIAVISNSFYLLPSFSLSSNLTLIIIIGQDETPHDTSHLCRFALVISSGYDWLFVLTDKS